jgi:hypothetical protein
MTNFAYKLEERRQKVQKKAYAILVLLVLLIGGWFFYGNWTAYSAVQDGLAEAEGSVDFLRTQAKTDKSVYDESRDAFDELSEEIDGRLQAIFPAEDQYTDLTRQIDGYEDEMAKKGAVFQISNLDFQKPNDTGEHMILPLRMNVRSSADNFTKFLHLIETSGALDDEVRLMDISSIRLNFENSGGEGNRAEIINFAVQINAYYQKS